MRNTWVSRVGMIALVGGLCLVGYGLAQAVQASPHRFVVLPPDHLGQVWVLDTTTALRWQKAPGNEPLPWLTASAYCPTLEGGSRLPEVKELISLVDYSQFNPALPAGHPFQDVTSASALYWSASTFALTPSSAWFVNFLNGFVNFIPIFNTNQVWCVR